MSASSIPQLEAFFHAILTELARHPSGVPRRDIYETVADAMGLTREQREEWLPQGRHLRYRHRIGWSLNMLKTAGYAESPGPRLWRLTMRGSELLAAHPQGFDEATTRNIAREGQGRGRTRHGGEVPRSELSVIAQQSPDELIDGALKEIEDSVARELLERIAQSSPAFFERVVLELLHALGYGASEADLSRVGGPGDAGIDGIISLDKLGFEKVHVQAKRWQGPVGRPEVQAFFGALAGQKAKKGVLITTSSFTREAQEFGSRVADSVVLIDGSRLAELMIESGVGVTHYRVIRLPRVDEDYFETE